MSSPMIAPRIPVMMTNIAVSSGRPPTSSETFIANGELMDRGSILKRMSSSSPTSFDKDQLDNIAVKLPANTPSKSTGQC